MNSHAVTVLVIGWGGRRRVSRDQTKRLAIFG